MINQKKTFLGEMKVIYKNHLLGRLDLIVFVITNWKYYLKGGAPERIRTSGLLNRNQMLYPAELRVQLFVAICTVGKCK